VPFPLAGYILKWQPGIEWEPRKGKTMGKKKPKPAPRPASAPPSTGEMPEQSSKETQADFRLAPPSSQSRRRIHPRAPIPPPPAGEDVPDPAPSPPVELE